MLTTSHLDYFTASYYEIKTPRDLNLFSESFEIVEPIRPMPHYDLAWRLKCGGTVNVAHGEAQGARIDLGGVSLEYCRAAGMRDAQTIIELAEPHDFKQVTRLDYCWDIQDAGSVRHTANHWQAGKCKTSLRGNPSGYINYGNRTGRTIYFGSPKSTQRVRIYDKATEMKLLNQALLRVELQVRKPHSQAMYIDIVKSSVQVAARSRLKSVLDFPRLQWWCRALEGDTDETTTVERKTPKWQAWLLGRVSESIKKHWSEDKLDDRDVISKWIQEISRLKP